VLGRLGLKGVVWGQMTARGVVLRPKHPPKDAIVVGQNPRAGDRAPPSGGSVEVAISTDAQPNNTPRQVRLGAGKATAAYPIAVPSPATHQLTVLVTMPTAGNVTVWLEPISDRHLPVASTPDATGCLPTGAQVHCRKVFAALDAQDSGQWWVRLAIRSAMPANVQITVVVAPR
jgi:hypothetical protein